MTFIGADFVVYSHAGDDWQACKDHVRQLLGMGSFAPRCDTPNAVAVARPSPDANDRAERARTIWHEGRSIQGTPAEDYLARRGLSYSGSALRWHPACPFGKGERHGCMIGLVRNIISNKPQAVHRTAIDAHGNKIAHLGSNGRMSFGPVAGGAIKLADDDAVTVVIAIGEGIETALSVREVPDLSEMPVWSVLSASGIAGFPPLPGIEAVWIAADNDGSGTGQRSALTAAERLLQEGIEAVILSAEQAGADLNDRVALRA